MSDENDWTDDPTFAAGDDCSLDERIADMKKREAQEMPAWFLPALGGALAWMGLFIWLAVKVNWPEAYGFRGACVRRGCLIESIIRSPVLLQHPTSYSLALFAWFAATGAAIAAAVLYCTVRKPSPKSFVILAVVVGLIVVLALQPVSEWDV